MRRAQLLLGTAWIAFALSGCEPPKPPAPPPAGPSPELAKRAVLALLPGLQFGPDGAQHTYREIRAVEVAGSHFVPAANRWAVHYCVDFTNLASDAPQRRCDLSVEVYELDSKKWVGFARGIGTLYRWQVLEPAPPSAEQAEAAPSEPAAQKP